VQHDEWEYGGCFTDNSVPVLNCRYVRRWIVIIITLIRAVISVERCTYFRGKPFKVLKQLVYKFNISWLLRCLDLYTDRCLENAWMM